MPVGIAPLARVHATLRVAATDAERQAAIGAWLQATDLPGRRAILAEGVLFDRAIAPDVPLIGLTGGCPCCVGSPALRVTLARTLRKTRAESVLLLLATEVHLPRLRQMLEDNELGVHFEVEG